MTPFIKVTPDQAQAILAGDPQVWQKLQTEGVTPELDQFIQSTIKALLAAMSDNQVEEVTWTTKR